MTAFTLIPNGWFDPFELVASLRPRMGWFKDPEITAGHWALRITPKVIEKWPELGNALTTIEAFGQDQYERGETRLHMVSGGGAMALIPANGTVLTVLRTNPNVTLAGPSQTINPSEGLLVAVAQGMCVMNMGNSPWVGLLIEARVKQP